MRLDAAAANSQGVLMRGGGRMIRQSVSGLTTRSCAFLLKWGSAIRTAKPATHFLLIALAHAPLLTFGCHCWFLNETCCWAHLFMICFYYKANRTPGGQSGSGEQEIHKRKIKGISVLTRVEFNAHHRPRTRNRFRRLAQSPRRVLVLNEVKPSRGDMGA